MCALFQQAADDGAEAFATAASTYGPPAVLCAGAVGGIDVSAYGFTVEPQPLTDEPAGDDIHQRLDDLAAEVHAAANCKVHYTHASFPPPAVLEPHASALVCGPAAAGNMPEEQTVNHAAIAPVDLTGYDTDDYEDFADGSFRLKPRAVPDAQSAAGLPSPGGDLDWGTPSIFSTNEFVESVIPAQGFFVADNVPPLEPPEPPDIFQDLAQADLSFDMAFFYGVALHERGPFGNPPFGSDLIETTAGYFGAVD
ncbi:hypothetical protein CYMTET_5631 [Cymbomonas tetramitiformis]|uniref:Uncharacterized protein n=1 Tax=Cymbomonas tetramitiformis TaxID=36881 RepID=A0AAE0GZ37_9CHLO|nr:hypothetical protein CYMTET_5631 [Cymbomonas tetramitiformis]